MMLFEGKSKCKEKQKIISCREGKCSYTARNIDSDIVGQYHIDGDIIRGNLLKRCDYLVEIRKQHENNKHHLYFVELKGSDIRSAYKQILQTMNYVDDYKSAGCYYLSHARVVYTKCTTHAVNDNNYRDLKKVCKDITKREMELSEDV